MLFLQAILLYEWFSLIASILGFIQAILQAMSPYEWFSLIASVLGFFAVIWSIRLLNESLKASTYEASREHLFEFNQILINNPELRPYFYESGDPNLLDMKKNRDKLEYQQVMMMAENFLDFIDSSLIQQKRFPQVWPKNWWLPYFEYIFAHSPVLCGYLESKQGWYQPELTNLMKKALIDFIVKILEDKQLKDPEKIASLLEIKQDDVSHLMKCEFKHFTTDKLQDFRKRLDPKS